MLDDRIREIIDHARCKSPYYRELYKDLPLDIESLSQVPRVNHTTFWAANSTNSYENKILTEPFTNGAIFRTGGTTSKPKSSFFTRSELDRGIDARARSLVKAGLQPGDRVANLLYVGNMYKGFIDVSDALPRTGIPNVHLSIGGITSLKHQAWGVKEFEATLIVAFPTVACRLASHYVQHGVTVDSVRSVIFSGELLYKEQKALLLKAFPNAKVGPLSYVSVDGGLVGIPVSGPDTILESQPVYQVDQNNIVLELIDEHGNNIREEGLPGEVVITSLHRRLMPIIRYSMGDLAIWTNFESKHFQVLGRSTVGVTVGQSRFDLRDLRAVITRGMTGETVHGVQILLRRSNGKDEMVFRIAASPREPECRARKVREEMDKTHEYDRGEDQYFNPLLVEFVSLDDLVYNEQSGKLREVVDLRLSEGTPVKPNL
ncbi:MAG: hypothetical protein Q9195_007864 [Heterodermia aff. obscurata]